MATSSPRIFKFTSRRSPKLIHLAMSLPSTEDSEEAPNFKGPLKRTSEEEHWQKKLAEEHQPLGKCGWSTQSIGMLWNSMQSIYLVSEIFKCLTGSLTIGTTLNCSSSLEVQSLKFKQFQAVSSAEHSCIEYSRQPVLSHKRLLLWVCLNLYRGPSLASPSAMPISDSAVYSGGDFHLQTERERALKKQLRGFHLKVSSLEKEHRHHSIKASRIRRPIVSAIVTASLWSTKSTIQSQWYRVKTLSTFSLGWPAIFGHLKMVSRSRNFLAILRWSLYRRVYPLPFTWHSICGFNLSPHWGPG